MGIFGAMTTAVAGLQAQSFALENISGNIANSQTTGFKRMDTSFADIVNSLGQTAERQGSGSVMALSRSTNMLAGPISASSIDTHMAISGDGYFQVQSKVGETDGVSQFSGANVYTRRGDFVMDREGYLVNGAGYYLMAIPVDPGTGNPQGDVPEILKISTGFLEARQSTRITYQASIPSNPRVPMVNTADYGVGGNPLTTGAGGDGVVLANDFEDFRGQSLEGGSTTLYDALGAKLDVQFRWAQTATSPETWNLFYQSDPSATGTQPMWTNVGTDFVFDNTGKMTSPTSASISIPSLSVSGHSLGNITLDYDTDGIRQNATSQGDVIVNVIDQDGYTAGSLVSVAAGDNGRITATYTNGQQVDIAEVPLFQFNGDSSLKRLDGGAFSVTRESGPAMKMNETSITGQALEGSNTDIAEEFSRMIITQQAYSANSRIISTANDMMQDVLNIIR
ncbi:flagellar hook protein FlgE [Prosthecomicrobium sp. N25]|uniref:flagellar hook protein FlgE n=1 Tax=Prosthecomicrobium sp. N25 TaxID=3129254 RepID=UPI003078126C